MRKKQNKRLDFLPNKQNKYSIRKFTVGTASILVGATLIFGAGQDVAKAEENNQTKTESNQSNSDVSKENTSQNIDSQESAVDSTQTTIEQPSREEKATTEATTEQPSTEEKATKETIGLESRAPTQTTNST
ncbi:YSIRK-type signal peptide-containing protein [Staphylococcus devriesei]|nr:YSIRK-type signal peptide-containing protein [Staphylococcus devriesei]MCE5091182.1 YSIRK-type signal peptide-containing protein [Staphylococcus devriesei]